ncbi:MAG: hypothetical protein ACOC5F_04555, partial [Candidatus Aminicenantaceae bacterium]
MGGFATTNHRLRDKEIAFDFVQPFDLIPKYKEKCERSPAPAGRSEQSISSKNPESFEWSQLLNEARTFFEQQSAL